MRYLSVIRRRRPEPIVELLHAEVAESVALLVRQRRRLDARRALPPLPALHEIGVRPRVVGEALDGRRPARQADGLPFFVLFDLALGLALALRRFFGQLLTVVAEAEGREERLVLLDPFVAVELVLRQRRGLDLALFLGGRRRGLSHGGSCQSTFEAGGSPKAPRFRRYREWAGRRPQNLFVDHDAAALAVLSPVPVSSGEHF
jgi:hypothetical protein